jgi:hypothetical protein
MFEILVIVPIPWVDRIVDPLLVELGLFSIPLFDPFFNASILFFSLIVSGASLS